MSAGFTFASSYVTVTVFLALSDATLVPPFTSWSADSVRAAQPPQCQPDTFTVSVFSPAKAAVASPAASRHPAIRFFMMVLLQGFGRSDRRADSTTNYRATARRAGHSRWWRAPARPAARRAARRSAAVYGLRMRVHCAFRDMESGRERDSRSRPSDDRPAPFAPLRARDRRS